jgi:hypothetical protein
MIQSYRAATGVALAATFLFGCRDAPTAPTIDPETPSFSATSDSLNEMPGAAAIYRTWTKLRFSDGRFMRAGALIIAGMEYKANRAAMNTRYSITGEETISSQIFNQQDSYLDLLSVKTWEEEYFVPTTKNCGLRIGAGTQHDVWWHLWFPSTPLRPWESPREIQFSTADPVQTDPCPPPEPEPSPEGSPGGGGSYGGWITIETCYYWAHYVNGVLVDIELRYCEYDQIPIADE